MTRAERLVGAGSAATLAMIAGCWTVWALRSEPGTLPVDAQAPPSAAATFRLVGNAGTGSGTAVILDAAGAPIAGARLLLAAPAARQLLGPAAVTIASSGVAGTLDLPPLPPAHVYVVAAAGHRTVALPALAAGQRIEVRLRPAARLTFRCRDRRGAPVAGARLLVSRSAIADLDAVAAPAIPGGDPLTAIHAAVSAEDGSAVIDGLDATGYGLAVDHPGMVLVDGPRGAAVAAPATVELTFAEPWARVLRCSAGRITAGGSRFPRGALLAALAPLRGLDRVRAAIQRQHPDAFVEMVMRPPGATAALPFAGVVVVEDAGTIAFDHTLVPLSDTPHLVADLPPPPPQPLAELHISVAAGTTGAPRLCLSRRFGEVFCTLPVAAGKALRLPPGSYALTSDDPLARRFLPRQRIDLCAPVTHHEVCLGALQPVPVRLEAEDGSAVGGGSLVVEVEGRQLACLTVTEGGRCLWLAPGEYRLQADLLGRGTAAATVRVPRRDPETVRLRLRRRAAADGG